MRHLLRRGGCVDGWLRWWSAHDAASRKLLCCVGHISGSILPPDAVRPKAGAGCAQAQFAALTAARSTAPGLRRRRADRRTLRRRAGDG
ncbi:hypothetical protein MHJ63_00345 [Pseudoglutamicibacter albus]|uniref:hypothetical protein n=1 Tax=Pseudoglutamicibacter albus TaxID=98671 RepID=UPI001EF6E6E1|nr:hypothetical protein [Pseudoglutamicibacter albus]MCG7303741.1 hypothetical protein [Pseudoglutamicibacter albus]